MATCSCLWNLTEILYDPHHGQTKLEHPETKAKEALGNDSARTFQEPVKTIHEPAIPRTLSCQVASLAITHCPHTAESSAWEAVSCLAHTSIWDYLTLSSIATCFKQECSLTKDFFLLLANLSEKFDQYVKIDSI